jgi:putative ubiquitin-RnfH superfamily antitoxin RatB of RatAB toxin-antitoxin module
MTDIEFIAVEVVYALPHRQQLLTLNVPLGTTAFEAVRLSGIVGQFSEIDLENVKMGIFGQALGTKGLALPKEYVLWAKDRVEIYRPLIIDPKEVRKLRAEKVRQQAGKQAK